MNRNIIKRKTLITICLACFMAFSQISFAQTVADETVDLGIGIAQSKKLATTSTVTITSEDLEKTSAINLQDALYGRLLGLTALKSGGFSGDGGYGGSFNIRGTQTTNENNVLILVDGFERPIDRLSIREVESVTVLKDAAAVALYGFRGINGVISVKTKHTKSNTLQVGVSYDHKFQTNPTSTQFVDAYGYANALNEARLQDGLAPAYKPFELQAFQNGTYPTVYPNVDWKKQAMRNTASEDHATVTISGGNSKLKYFTMIDYVSSLGILNGTETNEYSTQLKYSKANIRENIDFVLTPTTKMQVNLMSTFDETNQPNGVNSGDVMSFIYNTPASAYPVLLSDGKTWGGTAASGANNIVARIQATGHNKSNERSLFADAKLTQDLSAFLSGLSASVRLGYDNRSQITETNGMAFQYGNTRYNFDNAGAVHDSIQFAAGNKTPLSFLKWLNNQWRSSNFQANIDYVKSFGNHNMSASLIYTTNQTVGFGQFNVFNRANLSLTGHYDYANKYIADLVVNGAGSNRAWPQKYAFNPTLSAGWVLTNEDFLKNNDVINFMKLRASAGILHSDYVPIQGLSLENYGASAGWFTFGAGYNESWGKFLSYFPTKNFALETANKINVGLDTKFWNSLEMTIEGYYQRRDNILQSADALNTAIVGIPSSYVNKGIVDSKGVEVGLNYKKTVGDFTVNAGALFTYGTNKIIDMVETPQAYAYLSRIGLPVNQSFGLQAIGFYKDAADVADPKNPIQTFDRVVPGDVKYKDVNNDGRIDANDMVAMGKNSPEINYSFTLGAEFKGFGFNVLFQGTGNYTQYLGTQGVFNPLVNNSNLSTYYNNNCWHPGQDNSNAIFPRLTSLASPNNYQSSSLWYKDASFLKLRNCEVYYKLPKNILNAIRISDVKIYVKGENLLSFSNMPANMDPENMWGGYPILPAFSVGTSIKF